MQPIKVNRNGVCHSEIRFYKTVASVLVSVRSLTWGKKSCCGQPHGEGLCGTELKLANSNGACAVMWEVENGANELRDLAKYIPNQIIENTSGFFLLLIVKCESKERS